VRSRLGGSAGLAFATLALALGGCGSLSGGLRADSLALAAPPASLSGEATPAEPATEAVPAGSLAAETAPAPSEAVLPAVERDAGDGDAGTAAADGMLADSSPLSLVDATLVAQTSESQSGARQSIDDPIEEYDPLEKFNEVMFEFNRGVDRYVLKPIAKAYNFIMPDELQRMIARAYSNITVVPRVVNNLLQGKWAGAGREVGRFLINSIAGIGGLWDIARQEFSIEPSKADFGQTLGKWGAGPGAYLILPFLPPLTVRDGIGYAVDGAMDPMTYFVPFIWERLSMKILDTINDRSLNLDLFQGFEETTVDFYSAVRNGYLQRRYRLIHED